MAEVKWIKLDVDMFSNPKIRRLRRLPDGDKIILIWVMLLTMAGRCNAGGMIFITQNIPYTVEDLADELGYSVDTVRLAIRSLEEMGMVSTNENNFEIVGWNEHQNEAALSTIREYNRHRKAEYRASKKETVVIEKNDENVSQTSHGQVHGLSYSYSYSISNNLNLNNLIYILNNNNDNKYLYIYKYIEDNTELLECIKNWMKYKDEKKPKSSNHYTETGLKTLLKKFVDNDEQYGTDAIVRCVDDSMANNYQGIIWDRLSKPASNKNSCGIDWANV